VAVVAQLEQIPRLTVTEAIMLEEGAEMLGNLLLLVTMTVHARFVILEASGEIKVVERKRRSNAKLPAAIADHAETSDDEAPARHSAKAARTARRSAAADSADSDERTRERTDEAHDSPSQRRLTKAQRKALRRSRRTAGTEA
jgi:biopolymer transport protein ExbB/TolQ